MDDRIDLEKGFFCREWPKCWHGSNCAAKYDGKIMKAERDLWFKKRVRIKFFEETPECMNEIKGLL